MRPPRLKPGVIRTRSRRSGVIVHQAPGVVRRASCSWWCFSECEHLRPCWLNRSGQRPFRRPAGCGQRRAGALATMRATSRLPRHRPRRAWSPPRAGGAASAGRWSFPRSRQSVGASVARPHNNRLHLTAPREALNTFRPGRIGSGAILSPIGRRARSSSFALAAFHRHRVGVDTPRPERTRGAAGEPASLYGQNQDILVVIVHQGARVVRRASCSWWCFSECAPLRRAG